VNVYRVAKAAKFLGVSVPTMRRWDEKGELSPINRTSGGHRLYTEEQLVKHRDSHIIDRERSLPTSSTITLAHVLGWIATASEDEITAVKSAIEDSPDAPHECCRPTASAGVLLLQAPLPTTTGKSPEAKQRAREYAKAKRDTWVRCIRGEGSNRGAGSWSRKRRTHATGEILIDENGEKLKTDVFKSNVMSNRLWDMPPRDDMMDEANVKLKEAMSDYDMAHQEGSARLMINDWVYRSGEYDQSSNADLGDELYPPLPLMVAKGRGAQCLEVKLWYKDKVSRRAEGEAIDFFTRQKVQTHLYGHTDLESSWVEFYLKTAYAWRFRDLLKRKM
jgi:hypothetical protein